MATHIQRFTNRVSNYIRSRPSYPEALMETLRRECGLMPSWAVADVGSGTGILSELFLKDLHTVFGIEPNSEMREASQQLLAEYPNYFAIDGSAEMMGILPGSVRLITAAQSFHWFDQAKARREFARVLQPGGYVAIVFNTRKVQGSAFGNDYEQIVKNYGSGAGFSDLRHENLTRQDFESFFGPKGCAHRHFPYHQYFDMPGLKGRMASMSWVPLAGDPRYDLMMADTEKLFVKHEQGGRVDFEYLTELHYGQMS